MSKKDVKRRYKGRIETVAAQATIVELVEAGYSHAMIYDILRDKGAVSVSYRQFCRCVRQMIDAGQKTSMRATRVRKKVSSVVTPHNEPAEQEVFGRRFVALGVDDVC